MIAILAGMLLPALNKARNKAKQASCMNGLKQLGLIAPQYSQDFGDQIVPIKVNRKPASPNLYSGYNFMHWHFLLYDTGYLAGPELFFGCPNTTNVRNAKDWSAAFRSSFGYNEHVNQNCYQVGTGRNNEMSNKVGRIKHPSQLFFFMDSVETNQASAPTASPFVMINAYNSGSGQGHPYARHDNMVNIMMFDGHVEARQFNNFYSFTTQLDLPGWKFADNPQSWRGDL